MKSSMDLRLECLKLATTLGSSKNITPEKVVPYAMEFFKWVENGNELASGEQVSQLKARFR